MSDIKMKEQSTPDQPELQVIPGSIKLDILLAITSLQHQNGLRVNDYRRYSHFCRKKINKLRKWFKLSQGKRKFQKVEITPDKITDNKVLLISIWECERNWSYGMFHKQELTAIGEDIKRLRYQITRKFKKASKNAKQIYDWCKQIGDTQTQLEGEAYYSIIYSNYWIFTRKFTEALSLLKRATNIYEKISQLKDTIESIEYKDKINGMKTSMRLCMYNLSTSKDVIFDEEEFEKTVNVEDIELTEKIEEIKKTKSQHTSVNQEEGGYSIQYHGMSLPIKNEKLKDYFMKLNELSNKIEKEREINKKTGLFQDYYNKIDEMIKIVKKEKTEETAQQTENFQKIYTSILTYIEGLRLKKYIDKNITFIADYSQDYNIEWLTTFFEKDNIKLRVKPQEIMKLYDNLIEYQTQLISWEKENPEQSYWIDLNFRGKVYTFSKIFYAGCFYILNKKYKEAYTWMFYIIDKIRESNEFYSMNNLSNVTALREWKQGGDNLEKMALFIINNAFVKMSKEKEKGNWMEIDDKKKEKKVKYNTYWYESMKDDMKDELNKDNYVVMGDWVKLGYEEYLDAKDKNNYNNYSQIMQLPMNLELMKPKPIIYDLIYEQFDYPSLEEKMKKEQKGIMGRAFGYFWGSK